MFLHALLPSAVLDTKVKRFEVSIDEENVSLLDIDQSRGGISDLRVLGANSLNVEQSLVQKSSSHEHTVLLTIVRD